MWTLTHPLGQITQGTIFCCARANRYQNCSVSGLIITARCDLSNDKFPVLNYLPIVTLADWLRVDGAEIVLQRQKSHVTGILHSCLRQNLISSSLLYSLTPRQILEGSIQSSGQSGKAKKAIASFTTIVDSLEILNSIDLKVSRDIDRLQQAHKKPFKQLVKDVILNKVPSYYYLPAIEPNESDSGYVILMREVQSVPRELVSDISNGGTSDEINARYPDHTKYFSFSDADFVMPIGLLKSPYIEHILQTFSGIFARIGLDDYDVEYIEKMSTILETDEGEA